MADHSVCGGGSPDLMWLRAWARTGFCADRATTEELVHALDHYREIEHVDCRVLTLADMARCQQIEDELKLRGQ